MAPGRAGRWVVLLGALGLAAVILLIGHRREPAVPTDVVEQKLSRQVRVQAVMFAYETGMNRPAADAERTTRGDGATS